MKSETKITLEQYLLFYEDPRRSNLLRAHLNQIIVMHGFIKLHNFPKVLIQEYLGSVELIPPTRSTLDEDISAGALLTMTEVADDLAVLGWHECGVRSLRTLNPVAELEYFTAAEADQIPRPQPRPRRRRLRESSRAPPADFVIMGRRPRSKRKRVSINALTAADMFAASSPGPRVLDSSTAAVISASMHAVVQAPDDAASVLAFVRCVVGSVEDCSTPEPMPS